MEILEYQTPVFYTDETKDYVREMVERFPNQTLDLVDSLPKINRIMQTVNHFLRMNNGKAKSKNP